MKSDCSTEELVRRFELKVDRTGGEDSCHLWRGSIRTGYGRFQVGRRSGNSVLTQAHRFELERAIGRRLAGDEVARHLCESRYAPGDITYRRCCNPLHLQVGSLSDNMQDMLRSGRDRHHGTRNHQHKLQRERVEEILARARAGELHEEIAKSMGISRRHVTNISSGLRRAVL